MSSQRLCVIRDPCICVKLIKTRQQGGIENGWKGYPVKFHEFGTFAPLGR
jgi:hypothetical protein